MFVNKICWLHINFQQNRLGFKGIKSDKTVTKSFCPFWPTYKFQLVSKGKQQKYQKVSIFPLIWFRYDSGNYDPGKETLLRGVGTGSLFIIHHTLPPLPPFKYCFGCTIAYLLSALSVVDCLSLLATKNQFKFLSQNK